MTFKEFVYSEVPPEREYLDMEVANMYLHNPSLTVREIADKTGRSIGEMYRLLKRFGGSNRSRHSMHSTVLSLADSDLPIKTISDITGYTTRHIRNILKK